MFSLLPICVPVRRSSCVPLSLPQVLTPVLSPKNPLLYQMYCMFYFWRNCCDRTPWIIGDIFPLFIFIIHLWWCLGIWVCGDNCSRYWSLCLSCLGGNYITEIVFAVLILTECWLHFAPFTYLFGGYVQERMLPNVESWEKWQAGRYDLSNPPGDIVTREV